MKHLHIKEGKFLDDLWISEDTNDLEQTNRVAVFLFTPNMKNTDEHYHIELEKNEATLLRDWLNEFLRDTA